ncbi:MAG: hypothetical protein KME60_03535 [Cyanomargarita calcarea GSE-NOS-MK-12-04C]|jgi:predicted  nucleic acid-binding Zn-ribbon protein|uniref:Uncharacterized protein n=1 Tax=Cyanomargarita calcarea GSE-NOS-MK-12-04C TaxID=2839659 RepID=A0A951QHH4_9CYAN|nr:hypothetical protein [Cyanomargarita calcarea GSE-NOS-MK-12-04C]
MQFQFTEVANMQQQIEALTAQLQQLTASVAPYTECQKEANWLVEKTAEHRAVMLDKGLTADSLKAWAIALHEAASGEEFSINLDGDLEFAETKAELARVRRALEREVAASDERSREMDALRAEVANQAHNSQIDEVEALRSENKSLILDYQELNKKLDFFKSEIRENDSLSAEVLKLRKENENYQQRYDGIKAQKEQIEQDFFAVRADRDAKVQELKNKTTNPYSTIDEHIDAMPPSEAVELVEEPKSAVKSSASLSLRVLEIDDIVSVPTGGLGTVIRFSGDIVVVGQLLNGETVETCYDVGELRWISSYQESAPAETLVEAPDLKYEQFLAKIAKAYGWNTLTWQDVRSLVDCKAEGFKELSLAKATKVQKEKRSQLLSANGRCVELLFDYIELTGDRSDLDWVPVTLKEAVEEEIAKKPEAQLVPGTEIEVDGETMIVIRHDVETEWLDVQTLKGVRTSVHMTEVTVLSNALPLTA